MKPSIERLDDWHPAPFLRRYDRPSWPSRIATWIVCTVLGAGFGVLVLLWMAGVG